MKTNIYLVTSLSEETAYVLALDMEFARKEAERYFIGVNRFNKCKDPETVVISKIEIIAAGNRAEDHFKYAAVPPLVISE